jgi:hypothetical protein
LYQGICCNFTGQSFGDRQRVDLGWMLAAAIVSIFYIAILGPGLNWAFQV